MATPQVHIDLRPSTERSTVDLGNGILGWRTLRFRVVPRRKTDPEGMLGYLNGPEPGSFYIGVTAEFDDEAGRYFITRSELVGGHEGLSPRQRAIDANSIRNYPLAEPLRRAVALASLRPDGDGDLAMVGPNRQTTAIARRVTTNRVPTSDLERVAELARSGGRQAVVAGLPCSERTAYRLLAKAEAMGLDTGRPTQD
jgi:hypothetical protein